MNLIEVDQKCDRIALTIKTEDKSALGESADSRREERNSLPETYRVAKIAALLRQRNQEKLFCTQ